MKPNQRPIWITFALLCSTTQANIYVVPDPTVSWGRWQGWGTSLCWWANSYGTRDDLADLVFTRATVVSNGEIVPGLGLNIARYNAGASTESKVAGATIVKSSRLYPNRQIQGYWLNPQSEEVNSPSWDWNADANQRAMLLKAKQRGADTFELFSNSPLWWLCDNHNPSGAKSTDEDNLSPKNYRRHAVYLASIAKVAHEKWGIDFQSVEPFNEPKAPYWSATGNQEGCHFSVPAQQSVISELRNELDRRGLKGTLVAASDETAYNQAASTWKQFKRSTQNKVGRVNVHGYQWSGKRDLLRTALGPKTLWNSEYGDDDATGKTLVTNLNLDLQLLHPSAWCYWQVVDGGGWGLINGRRGTQELRVSTKHYVLAQYTRHIRPGMQILESGDMNTVVAYDEKSKKLVIIAANFGATQSANYYLNNFATVAGPVSRWSTTFGPGDRYTKREDFSVKDKVVSGKFEANSIQTLEVSGVEISSAKTGSL